LESKQRVRRQRARDHDPSGSLTVAPCASRVAQQTFRHVLSSLLINREKELEPSRFSAFDGSSSGHISRDHVRGACRQAAICGAEYSPRLNATGPLPEQMNNQIMRIGTQLSFNVPSWVETARSKDA
jgi:hypothetical protein